MTTTYSLPGPDNITRETLDNGITVLVYENHAAPSVVVTGQVRAGSIYETAGHYGLASLTSRALMRGTHSRDFATIYASMEDIGADLSVIRASMRRASTASRWRKICPYWSNCWRMCC